MCVCHRLIGLVPAIPLGARSSASCPTAALRQPESLRRVDSGYGKCVCQPNHLFRPPESDLPRALLEGQAPLCEFIARLVRETTTGSYSRRSSRQRVLDRGLSIEQSPVSLLPLPAYPLQLLSSRLACNLQPCCLNCLRTTDLCSSHCQYSTGDGTGDRPQQPDATSQYRSYSLIHAPIVSPLPRLANAQRWAHHCPEWSSLRGAV